MPNKFTLSVRRIVKAAKAPGGIGFCTKCRTEHQNVRTSRTMVKCHKCEKKAVLSARQLMINLTVGTL